MIYLMILLSIYWYTLMYNYIYSLMYNYILMYNYVLYNIIIYIQWQGLHKPHCKDHKQPVVACEICIICRCLWTLHLFWQTACEYSAVLRTSRVLWPLSRAAREFTNNTPIYIQDIPALFTALMYRGARRVLYDRSRTPQKGITPFFLRDRLWPQAPIPLEPPKDMPYCAWHSCKSMDPSVPQYTHMSLSIPLI